MADVEQLQAENERLRAEVERLTFEMSCLQQQYDERTAYMIVHRGAALACSDSVRAAYYDEHHRAERLAEALRDARRALAFAAQHLPECNEPYERANAALAQEDRNG